MATVLKRIDDLPTLEGELWRDGPARIAQLAAAHGPIFKRELGQPSPLGVTRLVYLVGPEANRLVLHTHRDHFSHEVGWTPVLGPAFGKGLLTMDGDEWAHHRRLMNPAFTATYMGAYLPVMRRVVRRRTADWAARSAGGAVDLNAEAREIAFDVAAGTLIGLHDERVDELRRLFYALLHGQEQGETAARFRERMMAIAAQLRGLLLPLIAQRRAVAAGSPPPGNWTELPAGMHDVLQLLVGARDEQGAALSDAQLLGHLFILLVAGHETTTTLAAWLLYLLATHPDYLARVRAELQAIAPDPEADPTLEQLRQLTMLGHAVTEAGRLQSPVRFAPRGVVKDVEFAGYRIPAGTHVRYSIAAGHRLPHIFADPDRFDPDRFAPPREEDKKHPYALVTFGGGPRICIGVNMAQLEVKALAAHVLRRYDLAAIPGRAPAQVGAITGFPEHGFPVHVTLRPAA